jgi:hypothetical protein
MITVWSAIDLLTFALITVRFVKIPYDYCMIGNWSVKICIDYCTICYDSLRFAIDLLWFVMITVRSALDLYWFALTCYWSVMSRYDTVRFVMICHWYKFHFNFLSVLQGFKFLPIKIWNQSFLRENCLNATTIV